MVGLVHFSKTAMAAGTLILPDGRSWLHPDVEEILEQVRPADRRPRSRCVFTAHDADLPHLAAIFGQTDGYAHDVGVIALAARGDVHILSALQLARGEDPLLDPVGCPSWRDARAFARLYWAAQPNPFRVSPLWEYMCGRAVVKSPVAVFRHIRIVEDQALFPAA